VGSIYWKNDKCFDFLNVVENIESVPGDAFDPEFSQVLFDIGQVQDTAKSHQAKAPGIDFMN
jgi:hypothetical protein